MAYKVRWLRASYVLILAVCVFLLSRPAPTGAQFRPGGHMPLPPPVHHWTNLTFGGMPMFVFVPPPGAIVLGSLAGFGGLGGLGGAATTVFGGGFTGISGGNFAGLGGGTGPGGVGGFSGFAGVGGVGGFAGVAGGVVGFGGGVQGGGFAGKGAGFNGRNGL